MKNGLIIRKESLFEKVKKFFKMFFKKNEEIIDTKSQEENYEKEKEYTLKLYQDLKNGRISSKSIPDKYLEKIKVLLQEELKMEDKRIYELDTECKIVKYQIKGLIQNM